MESINQAVQWYQQKIGAYDKQLWETSVEQRVLEGIQHVPKKTARVKSELIDVDLVRGSTFSKAKPEHGWLAVTFRGIMKVVMLPIFLRWWQQQTSRWFGRLLLLLYMMQVLTLAVYLTDSLPTEQQKQSLSLAHLTVPMILMCTLGIVHAHIVSSQVSQRRSEKKASRKQANIKVKKSCCSVVDGAHHDDQPCVTSSTGVRRRFTSRPRSPTPTTSRHMSSRTSSSHVRNDADVFRNVGLLEQSERPTECRVTRSETSLCAAKRDLRHASLNNGFCEDVDYARCNGRDDGGATAKSAKCDDVEAKSLECNEVEKSSKHNSDDVSGAKSLDLDVGVTSSEHVTDIGASENSANGDTSNDSLSYDIVASPPVNDRDSKADGIDDFVIAAVPNSVERSNGTDDEREVTDPDDQQPATRRRPPGVKGQRRRRLVASGKGQPGAAMAAGSHLVVRTGDNDGEAGVSSGDSDVQNAPNSPDSQQMPTSELDWDDTMQSEVTCSSDSSTSDETDNSEDSSQRHLVGDDQPASVQHVSSVMKNLASSTDKVSCMIWEKEDEVKKVDLTVLDLGWTIIKRVEIMPEACDYLLVAMALATMATLLPLAFRLYHTRTAQTAVDDPMLGRDWRETVIILNGVVQRTCFSLVFYFLLSVAESTFKQRLLYAKHFCYLTSCRRAKKYDMPHFRLNKVRNIKTWLSLRSFLKKRGPQRSVDTIVSFAFLLAITLVSYMCFQLLQDSGTFVDHMTNWELTMWCFALGVYLLQFMTLGTKVNRKYRNFSVLITEQINLYLHMEKKPHKKEELMLANNVLKLAEALLKELESPFKISGLSANHFLYNITKVVILSAFSAVLTELLGFKLKLYKIKIRT